MGALIDMTGQRFGRLTVVSRTKKEGDSRAYWICSCDCGGQTFTSGKYLRNGTTRSCGCLAVDRAREMGANRAFIAVRGEKLVKHGHRKARQRSPEYKTWLAIKRRCTDENHKDYPNWGGRGIRVCTAWDNSFEQFLADMGPRPTPEHQIDRIDPNGNYEPGNCRWVTPDVQNMENKRSLVSVEVNGIKFASLNEACRHFGVNPTAANYRIKAGIPVEVAVSSPAWSRKPRRTRESYLPKNHPDRART